jgi:hypothetical protein
LAPIRGTPRGSAPADWSCQPRRSRARDVCAARGWPLSSRRLDAPRAAGYGRRQAGGMHGQRGDVLGWPTPLGLGRGRRPWSEAHLRTMPPDEIPASRANEWPGADVRRARAPAGGLTHHNHDPSLHPRFEFSALKWIPCDPVLAHTERSSRHERSLSHCYQTARSHPTARRDERRAGINRTASIALRRPPRRSRRRL